METVDPLQQPWQERLLIFVLLCLMVYYLARVVLQFRGQGLSVRRAASESGSSGEGEDSPEEYQDDHSD